MKVIRPSTLIGDLLEDYPFLVESLASYRPQYAVLRDASVRAAIGPVATLERVAPLAEVPLDRLLQHIADEIRQQTGTAPTIAPEPTPTGSREKIELLKGIIRSLHEGRDVARAREEFARLIGQVVPHEIAAMEQELIREGMPPDEVQRLCDVHVSVVRHALDTEEPPRPPPGHPLDTYMRENREIASRADRWAELSRSVDEGTWERVAGDLGRALDELSGVEIHYRRKENQLFPALEAHGLSGPSQVMWALHDDVRRMLKEMRSAVAHRRLDRIRETGPELARVVSEMIYKEERILFPTAWKVLTEEEWEKIRMGDEEIGYLVPPEGTWPRGARAGKALEAKPGNIALTTGTLTLEQLDRMLVTLPVEFSFVDDKDIVRYYSGHAKRIFPRSPGVIGRTVQNCHPPKSLHVVNAILEAFHKGERDHARFWIPLGERLVHISYHAVRDEGGNYLGCVEVTQDITDLKRLEGKKRLLDWS